jgi:hypothetical protein
VSENRMLRTTFGPWRKEAEGSWERLHNEELHIIIIIIIMVIKSKRVRWVVHVVRMREMRNPYIIFIINLKGRGQSEKLGVNVRIIS